MSISDEQKAFHDNRVIEERVGHKDVLFNRSQRQVSDSSINLNLKSVSGTHKLYWQRWPILFLYYLAVVVNSIPFEVCAPIASDMSKIYGVDASIITLAATSYMAMHPIFSFACAQLIVIKGWAYATNLGVLTTILGSAMRLPLNKAGFSVVILGQIFCGLGRPLILNSQASLAANWFLPSQRTFIITWLNILHTFSMVISMLIPGSWIFKSYDAETDDDDYTEGHRLGYKLMWVEFLISLTTLPCLLFLRNKPPSMPSKNTKVEDRTPFLQAMRTLLKNSNFIRILLPYSIYFGLMKALLVVLEYIMHPFGFNSSQVSIAGSAPLVGALFSQAAIPYVINRYRKYKLIVSILLVASGISMCAFYFTLHTHNAYIVYTVTTLLGFFLMPTVPVMMELSCDVVFPIGASFAVGAMYVGATLVSVIGNQLLTVVAGGADSTKFRAAITIIFILVAMIIGLITFCFAKIRDEETVKSESIISAKSLMRPHTKSSLYERHELFNCSVNIGLVGDCPTIDFNVQEEGYQALLLSEDGDKSQQQQQTN